MTDPTTRAGGTRESRIVAPPGGVMTDEVGVITGDLVLRTAIDAAGAVTLTVAYDGGDEWHRVTGVAATLRDPNDLDAVHAVAVGLLHRPQG
ncbi:hypothetical protein [Pilimelia columellifera]|uniref:Uncharacterized protein n=1 Tax=Pilimelia columellifera subsp. columellifera TaxID=706583 RepID=A0ABP6AM88_9ACTN